MTTDRDLRLRFTTEGEDKVKQAVKGTSRAARQATVEQRNAVRDAADAEKRARREAAVAAKRADREKTASARASARESAEAEKRAVRTTVEARRRAMRAMVDDVEKAERQKRAEFERTRRQMERDARKLQREQDRARRAPARGSRAGGADGEDVFGLAGRFAPTAIMGGLGAALQRMVAGLMEQTTRNADALAQRAGAQGIPERTVSGADFQLELTRMGGEVFGDVDPAERARQLHDVQEEILRIAQATNQEPGALLAALATLQTEFSAFEFGRENIEAIGAEATRSGADVEKLARFAGLVRQQFGEMDTDRIFDIAAQGGLQGALTPEQLSNEFAEQVGLFRSFADPNQSQDPEAMFRQFVAMANVIRSSGANASTSAVLAQNLMASLSDRTRQEEIALATGGRVTGRRRDRATGETHRVITGGVQLSDFRDETGALDLAGYTEALANVEGFGSLESLRNTLGDQQASIALNTIIARRRDEMRGAEDNADMRELMNVSAEAGGAFRASNYAEVMDTAIMRETGTAIRGQVEGVRRAPARAEEAGTLNSISESLRQQGSQGQLLADLGVGSVLGIIQNAVGADALRAGVGAMIPGSVGGSAGVEGVISRALQQDRAGLAGPKTGAGADASKATTRAAMSEALHERPVRVEVVNVAPAVAADPVSPPTPARRSESPRARTGR